MDDSFINSNMILRGAEVIVLLTGLAGVIFLVRKYYGDSLNSWFMLSSSHDSSYMDVTQNSSFSVDVSGSGSVASRRGESMREKPLLRGGVDISMSSRGRVPGRGDR